MDTIYATMDDYAKVVFESFVKQCTKEGIKVVLVNSPTYIGANNKTIGLDEINNYFETIASENNTVYLNYNINYSLCNDTANFCVSVHMNPIGTTKFTIDCTKNLIEIGILPKSSSQSVTQDEPHTTQPVNVNYK